MNLDEQLPPGFLDLLNDVSPKYDDYMGRSPARSSSVPPKKRKEKPKVKSARPQRKQDGRTENNADIPYSTWSTDDNKHTIALVGNK